jgi:hypothetical protein
MKTHIETKVGSARLGDLLIDRPCFNAFEIDEDSVDGWLEHANQDGSGARIYCSQAGMNGSTSFNFQIKSYGKLSTKSTSKAKPKHIVSTAHFTINELEEILAYMKKVEAGL